MAERLAYARRASGLVRSLGLFDAFGVAFMNQGVLVSIGVIITLGVGLFLGGNIIVAAIISFLLAGFGITVVWGTLGGAMPRSGGPYVYNSRILHPLIGSAQSFGDAMIWLWWIGILAPLAIDPGVTQLEGFLGWQFGAAWLQSPTGIFIGATVVNILGFLFVVFGMTVFARVQRVFVVLGIGAVIVMGLVLTFTSHAEFVAHWNALAAEWQSIDYAGFLAAADLQQPGGMPVTWNWPDTLGIMLAMSWLFMYGNSLAYVGGEVRRPTVTMPWAQFLAMLVPFLLVVWIGWALYHSVGFEFLSATAWYDSALDRGAQFGGYQVPWRPNVFGLVATINDSWPVTLLMGLAFIAFNVWWVALSYLVVPRILLAWGMDRLAPRWFADINPRYASPIKNHILCFVIGEALIVMYTFVWTDSMQNIILTGFQITSVSIITAIAAMVFPYRKRVAHVWADSPYKGRRVLGLPLIVWGGAANLVYVGILLYALVVMKASEGFQVAAGAMFVGAWVVGIAWYFFWRARNHVEGVDGRAAYDRLPPE